MAQNINVDVTPNLFQPTLYYHQGDIGRAFTITISTKDGYTIPSGATVKIEATKPSGLGFSVSGTLSGNVVSFVSTEGMTDEYGRFPAQLKITSGNDILYTANFLMVGAINTHPASVTDGTAEQVISEITLLVERAETAASTAATDAANAAQARVDEMMDYLPSEVADLKSDFTNFNNISKPVINPLLCIVNYGTSASYGKYELEIYKDGGAFGFAYFNEPHDVLFDAYINGDEGVKFILTKITPQKFEFVSVRSNDAGMIYSFDRATNDIGIVTQNPCLDNIQNGDRIIIHFEGTTMYVCNRTKNTVNYVQNDVTAFGFVVGGNQGIVSYAFYGVDDIYYMISDLVSRGVQKKCYCFGDSITWYDGKIPDTDWTIMKTGTIPIKGYISYLNDLLGMDVSNYGISGETSIQICNRIKNTAFTNIDYCTITAGTNDFLQNLSIGTLQPIGNVQDTESSFYGAIQSAIEYIIGSNSNTRIVLISPIRAWKNVKTTPIAMTDVYAEALKNIAELYGLPFVDFYNNIGINELNKASFSIDDISNANVDYYLHPSNYYQMKMGLWLVNTMRGC